MPCQFPGSGSCHYNISTSDCLHQHNMLGASQMQPVQLSGPSSLVLLAACSPSWLPLPTWRQPLLSGRRTARRPLTAIRRRWLGWG